MCVHGFLVSFLFVLNMLILKYKWCLVLFYAFAKKCDLNESITLEFEILESIGVSLVLISMIIHTCDELNQ